MANTPRDPGPADPLSLPGSRFGLTPQQTDVLTTFGLGLKPDESGVLLGLAPSTVSNILGEIRGKLDVSSTVHAYTHALYHGWITHAALEKMSLRVRELRAEQRKKGRASGSK